MELKDKEIPLWNAAQAAMLGSMLHTAHPPNLHYRSGKRDGRELSPVFYLILLSMSPA